jgi:GGDEF domain-containing protein
MDATMPERSAAVMDTLLALHREREPRGVLHLLVRQLEPVYGGAVACAYLLDPLAGHFRCELVAERAREVLASFLRAHPRTPAPVPTTTGMPALALLADSGLPVHVTEEVPAVLARLWSREDAAVLLQALGVRFTAVAPVVGAHGPLGVVLLCVLQGWPVEVAGECTAHAAVALANLLEWRHAQLPDRDPLTGLLTCERVRQAGEREINRAERYRRALSVVVIELPEEGQEPARCRALAELVSRVVRQPDIVGALEPGRVVALLPETPIGGATAFTRRLREAAAGGGLPPLRCACAMYPQDGREWEALVEAAIARLGEPERPPVPNASPRGSLRAAFPTFRMAGNTLSRWG